MKKWLVALSTLALVAMIWLMPTSYAVHAEGTSTVSGGDTEIPTLSIDENYQLVITVPSSYQGNYLWGLYKDDEELDADSIEISTTETVIDTVYQEIVESGTYVYRVEGENGWTDSLEFAYTKPEKKLDAIIPEWCEGQYATFAFTPQTEIHSYRYKLGKYNESTQVIDEISSRRTNKPLGFPAGEEITKDLESYIVDEGYGEGKYAVKIQVMHRYIAESAHSDWSEWSELHTVTSTTSTELPYANIIGIDESYRFNCQANAAGDYEVECLKDGKITKSADYTLSSAQKVQFSFLDQMDESGVYQCRVRFVDNTDAENPIYGEWVTSDEVVYTKPEKKLATTSVTWDLEQVGVAKATVTEDCFGYKFHIVRWDEESGKDVSLGSTIRTNSELKAGDEITYTIPSKYLVEGGKYKVQVRLLNADITNVAHGDYGEYSDYYVYGESSTETVKLAAPENVTWLGWYASWDSVAECEGNYSVYVYKNGEALTKFAVEPADTELVDVVAELQAQGIEMEEGASYSVAVTANKPANVVNYETSELSAISEAQVWGEDVGLPVPKLIGMDEKYLAFYYQATAEGYYEGELVREGTTLKFYKGTRASKEKNNFTIIDRIDESGVYQCRVRFVDKTDAENPIYGEWCVSDEFVYIKPEEKLATASATWDLEQAGVAKSTLTEDCMGYMFDLWGWDEEKGEDVPLISRGKINSHLKAGQEVSYTIPDKYLEQPGKYKIRIRQLSHDFLTTAHGDWGEFSAYFVNGDVDAEDLAENAVEQSKTDAAGAVETITSNLSVSEIRDAMQNNEKFKGHMAEVEKNYATQQNIKVKDATGSEEAKKFVRPDRIKMVGAAFNAEKGKDVKLDITVPEKKKEVDKKYHDNVQLDIKLVTDGVEKHGKLNVPITITMPVPEGIDVDVLEIIHYFVTGGSEKVQFKDNEDGTITFTVDQFSTFVFANEAEDEEDEDDDDEEDEDKAIVSPAKDNVPKTGDSLPIALPVAMTVVLAGAALALKKREE